MAALIDAQKLRKLYPGFVLDDISVHLEKGYVMGLIGENGAGKTTTIKLLMGMIRRQGGDLRILGADPEKDGAEVRERIGYVSDENTLWPELKVLTVAKVIARFYRSWNWDLFRAHIKGFGIPENKKVGELSKGTRLKLNLSIALSHGAELLLMDEPSAGLDPVARDEFLGLIRDYVSDGTRGALFSTHITSDLDRIADYITFIREGRIVFSLDRESMEDRFSIVKGGGSLSPEEKKLFIGVRETAVGFEGLVDCRDDMLKRLDSIREPRAVERATIEQIMVFHGKE